VYANNTDKYELQPTAHAAAARSSLTTLIKDLRSQERQILCLSSALEKERTDHKKHLDDLKAAHVEDLAIIKENHAQQLANVEVKQSEELTRVKLWCEMNRPRTSELSRILEIQRRSALQAEMNKMKEEAEMKDLWNEARIRELEREKVKLEHQVVKMQMRWEVEAALLTS
jgi:hypothetical protein